MLLQQLILILTLNLYPNRNSNFHQGPTFALTVRLSQPDVNVHIGFLATGAQCDILLNCAL